MTVGPASSSSSDTAYVPLSSRCYRQIGKPLPSNVNWNDVVKTIPPKAYETSWWRALSQLLVTGAFLALGVTALYSLPWYLLPLGWVLLAVSCTGLVAIGTDCKQNHWVDNEVVNEIVGILACFPLLQAFYFVNDEEEKEPKKEVKKPAKRQSIYYPQRRRITRRHVTNGVGVTSSFLLFVLLVGGIYYSSGWVGVAKYWLTPFVTAHVWMHVVRRLRSGRPDSLRSSISQLTPAVRVYMPKPLEVVLNYLNTYIPTPSDIQGLGKYIPSYRAHTAWQAISSEWGPYLHETKLTVWTLFEACTRRLRHASKAKTEALEPEDPLTVKEWAVHWARRLNWVHVILLFSTPIIGLYGLMTTPLTKPTLIWSIVYYFLTGIGITAGYHRLWSHQAYDAHPIVQFLLCICASGAVEGSARWWCRNHRAHHRYTDSERDPYNAQNGFWYAHMGWMLVKPNAMNYGQADVTDLKKNPILAWQHRTYPLQVLIMGFILPTVVAGLGWGDWAGGYFYAGVLRLVFVHQSTFCVNSVAHFFGDHTFDDVRTPRDHIITAFLTLGEGYHNFHHEFPNDYRNGIRFYDYDPTKWVIRFCNLIGLTTNLRKFPKNEIEMGKINMKQKKLDEAKAGIKWPVDVSTLPVLTWKDIAARVKEDVDVVVIEDLVHDVSDFALDHPGGLRYIKSFVGKDATKAFGGNIYRHSNAARNLLANFRIGRLAGGKYDEAGKKNQ